MNKKQMLHALHAYFNVKSCKYDGTEYELTLAHRRYSWFLVIRGDCDDWNIRALDGDSEMTGIDKWTLRFADRLAKHMSKRIRHYKDPFKDINE